VTERHGTTLGNPASPCNSLVDGRGLVTPWGNPWSLDWWIGADDRWHFPAEDDTVRQHLVSLTPVVETEMRVPGGDAVQRVYAVRAAGRSDELLVMEIENRSPAPFAVAFAIQPGSRAGPGAVGHIDLDDRTVLVDGRPAVYLPRRPYRCAVRRAGDGDLALIVASGGAGEQFVEVPIDPAGGARGAFIYPVAHTAALRVSVPLVPESPDGRDGLGGPRRAIPLGRAAHATGGGRTGRRGRLPPPDSLPTAADAARAWQAQTRRGLRVELPPGRLADVVDANRRFLLVAPGGRRFSETAVLAVALDRWGFHAEAAEIIGACLSAQHRDGRVGRRGLSSGDEPAATGAVLWALGEHHRLTADVAPTLAEPIARSARWIERERHRSRRGRDPGRRGLLASGRPSGPDEPECSYGDSLWSLRGQQAAAEVLRALGEGSAAETASAWAVSFRFDLEASFARQHEQSGHWALPAGPGRGPAPASPAGLIGCSPLGLYPPSHPAMAATIDAVRDRLDEDGVGPGAALAPRLGLQLAAVELLAGDRRSLDRLAGVAESASETLTWSTDGDDIATMTGFCSLVRDLLVREVPGGLAVCTLLPEGWRGRSVEVHDAPTAAGRLSFAVRWHGERPALLWELDPRSGPVALTAPGLDPRWTSSQSSGEALLGPVAAPDP
jgi:hypothetical protein